MVADKLVGHDVAVVVTKETKIAAATKINADKYNDPTTGMEFVRVKGGCFQMGSPSSEKDRGGDEKCGLRRYV